MFFSCCINKLIYNSYTMKLNNREHEIDREQAKKIIACGYKFRTACLYETRLGYADTRKDIFFFNNRPFVCTDQQGGVKKFSDVKHLI